MDWSFASVEELAAALRAGEVTSLELTDDAISRIERYDLAINAICVRDFDRARAAARRADTARRNGQDRPLLGIPMTVKESFNITGLPTTWGLPQHANYRPAEDAVAVSRLQDAGAVILGKTNVPTMLQDWQSYNTLYGTTNNPWDLRRTPGGSSGGSAAALAAGFGALSIGSDLAGSLRNPAHFCGVYAHNPTFGLVAARGMVPPHTPALPIDGDLGVCGPMARTARDLSLLLDVLAGPDPLTQGIAYNLALPPARHQKLSEYRVLILDEHPLLPTGSAVRAGVLRVATALTEAGAHVERHSTLLPDLTDAALLYAQLMMSTTGARLPAMAYDQLRELATKLSANDQSLEAARLRGMVLSHRDWIDADIRREQHRESWRTFFAEFDVVVCPITPTPAFPHDHNQDRAQRRIDIDGDDHPYLDQSIWAGLATMTGLPATAIPAGRSPEGLPVGVQLIGPMFEDRTPLRLAELLEQVIGGFQPPT